MIPSFVSRVERPDRGGEWIGYLEAPPRGDRALGRTAWASTAATAPTRPSVELVHVDGGEEELLASSLFEAAGGIGPPRSADRVRALDSDERAELIAELAGERAQPPPPPRPRLGGGPLPLRDRLRLRRLPRPAAPPHADLPVAAPWRPTWGPACPRRCARRARATNTSARSRSRAPSSSASRPPGMPDAAPYALCLGYRIRYVLDLNAREAMHLIELRSGREGHPTYRAVAQAMHERIADVHPAIAAAMVHVDSLQRAAPGADHERDPHPPQARPGRPPARALGRAAGRQRPGLTRIQPSSGASSLPRSGSAGRLAMDEENRGANADRRGGHAGAGRNRRRTRAVGGTRGRR